MKCDKSRSKLEPLTSKTKDQFELQNFKISKFNFEFVLTGSLTRLFSDVPFKLPLQYAALVVIVMVLQAITLPMAVRISDDEKQVQLRYLILPDFKEYRVEITKQVNLLQQQAS